MASVSNVSNSMSAKSSPIDQKPKGKFQRFCDWCSEHKKAIAVAVLIIGIACFTFGAGAILSILAISNFSVINLGIFVVSLFTYKMHYWGLGISGVSSTGILFFTGIAGIIVGAGLIGYGIGKLSGLANQKKSQPM